MFLQMNRETLFITVKAFFPSAEIQRDAISAGGHIWLRNNRSIAFDENENGLCDLRACLWEETANNTYRHKNLIMTQDFFKEEELVGWLAMKQRQWKQWHGRDWDNLSAKIDKGEITADTILEKGAN